MGGTAIAGTRSDEIQTECETIPIASATNSDWVHKIAGRKSWSLNVGFLVLTDSDVRKLLLTGSTVTLKIKGRNATDANGVTGSAIIRTCKITAVESNLTSGSFSFEGSGPLT
jgi:predicted secreted protein